MLPVGVDSFARGQQPLRLKTQVGYLTRVLLLLNNCSFEKLRLTKIERTKYFVTTVYIVFCNYGFSGQS